MVPLLQPSPQDRVERSAWRVLTVLGIGAAWMNMPRIDSALVGIWNGLQASWWFRHDMFEPVLSVTSFFVWIHGWLLLDTFVMNSRAPNFVQRLRRYRLQDQAMWVAEQSKELSLKPDQAVYFSAQQVDAALVEEQKSQAPRASKISQWYKGWYWELAVYLVPLWAIASWTNVFAPRRQALAWAAPSVATVALQVLGGLFLYDLLFYSSHLLLHKLPPRIYRALHGKHHEKNEVRASDTVRLTVPEEAVDVVCSIAALRLLRAHPLSRAIYDIVITFLLVELHCGYDAPWTPQNILPSVFAGSRRHHHHHRSGRKYYQKFFKYLDDSVGKFIR